MYNNDDDIERMFNQEIRDKKRTATGIHHRASRRGYTGTIRTQVDYLKGKAKKEYTKAGEIKVSNMYDKIENVPSIKELEEMDYNTAKAIVHKIREKHTTKELAGYWKISGYGLYNKIFTKYGIDYKKGPRKAQEKAQDAKVTNQVEQLALTAAAQEPVKEVIKEVEKIVEYTFTGFQMKFGGVYSGKQISERLVNYIATLDQNSRYKMTFKVEEIENNFENINEVAADTETEIEG